MRQDITSLQDRIKAARAELDALKSAQPASGDSWVVYRSTTPQGVWDINLANVAAPYDQLVKITHKPDDGDITNGFARFFILFDYNSMVNLTYGGTYRDAADPFTIYTRIYGSGGAGSGFRAKVYAFSPKKGTLQITYSNP